jgi:hypothetical protein
MVTAVGVAHLLLPLTPTNTIPPVLLEDLAHAAAFVQDCAIRVPPALAWKAAGGAVGLDARELLTGRVQSINEIARQLQGCLLDAAI